MSVSRSLANSTLRALLRLLALSTFVLLLFGGGALSSMGNVDRGENVSLRVFRLVGLVTLLADISADMGRPGRRLVFVELVAGGRLT